MNLPPLPRCELPALRPLAEAPPLSFSDVITGAAAEQATEVRLARTPDALHVGFRVWDREPWATLTERDASLYTEEVVEIFLDPAGDLAAYVELEINPLGTVLDLMVRHNRRGWLRDRRWHCEGLRTEVTRETEGWRAEFFVPWAALVSTPPRPGDLWRANFARIDRPPGRPRELSAWSPTGVALFHVPDRFGCLAFS